MVEEQAFLEKFLLEVFEGVPDSFPLGKQNVDDNQDAEEQLVRDKGVSVLIGYFIEQLAEQLTRQLNKLGVILILLLEI